MSFVIYLASDKRENIFKNAIFNFVGNMGFTLQYSRIHLIAFFFASITLELYFYFEEVYK